jgi:hypothetical protein
MVLSFGESAGGGSRTRWGQVSDPVFDDGEDEVDYPQDGLARP